VVQVESIFEAGAHLSQHPPTLVILSPATNSSANGPSVYSINASLHRHHVPGGAAADGSLLHHYWILLFLLGIGILGLAAALIVAAHYYDKRRDQRRQHRALQKEVVILRGMTKTVADAFDPSSIELGVLGRHLGDHSNEAFNGSVASLNDGLGPVGEYLPASDASTASCNGRGDTMNIQEASSRSGTMNASDPSDNSALQPSTLPGSYLTVVEVTP